MKSFFQNLNGKKIAKEAAAGTGRTIGRIIGFALKTVLTVLLIAVCTGFLFVVIFAAYVKNTLSDELSVSLSDFNLNQSSTVYYFDKTTDQYEVLERLSGKSGDRTWVDYEEINPWFEKAAVAIEDKRFYDHYGVDWYRTFGAFYTVFFSDTDSMFGGSTLTQQLLKNVTHYDDITVKRKLLEIFRALQLEKTYTKEEIMEWYLNAVYFGNGSYGVQAAARNYFGKDQSELTLAECAAIIGITNNPSMYSPLLHPVANKTRQELILDEMYSQGYISSASDVRRAKNQKLTFTDGEPDEENVGGTESHYYSWYVDALIEDVIHDLMELKEVTYDTAQTMLFNAGYNIYATIDMGVQDIIDDVYSTFDNLPAGYRKSASQDLQSSIVLMDPYTGDILGLSGGIGKKPGSRVYNRATQMQRSPGSTIKPIASYSLCLDKGLVMPYTIFDDNDLVRLKGTSWYPNNDDAANDGNVTLRYALQVSINTVAAQMVDMLTPEVSYDQLVNKLGLTHLVNNENGFSDVSYAGMALGQLSYGETVREMCQAYTIFCNDGIYTEARTYSLIEDAEGNVVYENIPESHVGVSKTTAYYMTEMLTNACNRGTGWLAKFGNMEIAGKSGGSSSWKDRWFISYTPYLLAAVWTGYDTPENMGSSNPATGMWKQVMQQVHAYLGYEDTAFPKPEGMRRVTICCDTGLLATEACEHEVRGDRTMTLYMNPEDIPNALCSAHVYTDICSTSYDAFGADCPESDHARLSVLDLDAAPGVTLSLYMKDGRYPHYGGYADQDILNAYNSLYKSGDFTAWREFLESKDTDAAKRLLEETPYTLQGLVACRLHNVDPVSGWTIEFPHGYLINPTTGMYYDIEHDILIDQYSMKQVDWLTGLLIDPDTGDYINPYTGDVVVLTEEDLAAYEAPRYRRPPGYGGEDPLPPPAAGGEEPGSETDPEASPAPGEEPDFSPPPTVNPEVTPQPSAEPTP